jgi:metal transporter CNNM
LGLKLGAALTWLLYFFLAVTFVVAFPISAILDKVLGEEVGNVLSKNKMKRMFEMYEKDKVLTSSERKILSAALEM